MTARLLETNTNPLEQVPVDGVTVDVIEMRCAMQGRRWMPLFFERPCLRASGSKAIVSR